MIVFPGFLVFIALAALVGYIGRNRKFGFWGYFFASILLTPLVGLILVFASNPRALPVAAAPSPAASAQ